MSIRTKIIGCSIAILVVFGGASLHNYTRSRRANAQLMQVKDVFLPLSRLIVQLQGRTQGLVDDIRRAYYGAPTGAERSTFSRMVRDLYPYVIEKKFKDAESGGDGDGGDELGDGCTSWKHSDAEARCE